MRIRMIYILSGMMISLASFAQEKAITFNSIYMAGIAAGESGYYASLQTINGVAYKKWFTGIGVGFDYYKNKTVPLFVDIRTNVLKTKFFVFADLGYDFSSHDAPGNEVDQYNNYHFYGGLYSEIGAGYKIRLGRNNYLLLTSGYSYKKLNDKVEVFDECFAAPCKLNYTTYEYGYGRIIFKAGFLFNLNLLR